MPGGAAMRHGDLVPEDWTIEDLGGDKYVVRGTESAAVSIDFAARGFRGGVTWTGPFTKCGMAYTNRGWAKRLVEDAVAWMRGIR